MKTLDEVIAELEDEGLFADALHCLKEYRTTQTAYIKAMADLEDNPPLSWDELRTMEGKPVWVEFTIGNPPQWAILSKGVLEKNSIFERNYGKQWQAYRKETCNVSAFYRSAHNRGSYYCEC